jgi:hypothetical protein
MTTLSKKQAIQSAKQRLLSFLEEEEGIRDVGGFYKHSSEDLYFLEVFVPDGLAMRLLKRIDPILDDIADNNDFMIVVLPLPPVAATK